MIIEKSLSAVIQLQTSEALNFFVSRVTLLYVYRRTDKFGKFSSPIYRKKESERKIM